MPDPHALPAATAAKLPEVDPPVTVAGYKMDPLRRGYQVLWNYESIYWRRLVGNDAWGLYEVLRSFCYDGKPVCQPSVNFLLEILGLKERRVLTGWTKTVNGKEYRYPGLLEILQQHELATVEAKGEGAKLHYVFHVNLTPGLLTPEQVAQLPAVLQKRHAELIQRCKEEQQALASKRRPPKPAPPVPQPPSAPRAEGADNSPGGAGNLPGGSGSSPGGSGNLPEGSGNLPGGSGNLPDIQQQVNNTHRQTTARRKNNNNKAAPDPAEVVVALLSQGISKSVAAEYAGRYPQERILAKIEFLTYLQEADPGKVINPRGWLRRAIEEDWAAPDGYRSQAERAAAVQEDERRRQARVTTDREREVQRLAEAEERQQAQVEQLARWREAYGTTAETIRVWSEALATLRLSTTTDIYQSSFTCSQLLAVHEGTALIGVPNEVTESLFRLRLHALVGRALKPLLGADVKLAFTVLPELESGALSKGM